MFSVSNNFVTAKSVGDLAGQVADAFRQLETYQNNQPQFFVVNSVTPSYPAGNIPLGSMLLDQTQNPYVTKVWNGKKWVITDNPTAAAAAAAAANPTPGIGDGSANVYLLEDLPNNTTITLASDADGTTLLMKG